MRISIERKEFRTANGERLLVLSGLDLEIKENSFTCITGPSGCGKTTLLRILLGLDRDFVGSIDPVLTAMLPAAVFQEPRLLPWRNVEDNIRVVLPDPGRAGEVPALLQAVGLEGYGFFTDSFLTLA